MVNIENVCNNHQEDTFDELGVFLLQRERRNGTVLGAWAVRMHRETKADCRSQLQTNARLCL